MDLGAGQGRRVQGTCLSMASAKKKMGKGINVGVQRCEGQCVCRRPAQQANHQGEQCTRVRSNEESTVGSPAA